MLISFDFPALCLICVKTQDAGWFIYFLNMIFYYPNMLETTGEFKGLALTPTPI
jgi:hypothetical protein